MSKCPKCGRKLHLYNVSQFCPDCGTNLRFYNFEETFFREAKEAELSQAVVHVKIRHLKAAFIGSKLAIARLIVMLLPVVGLLIPAGSLKFIFPFKEAAFDISGLGIYNMFSGSEFNYIMSMVGSDFSQGAFAALRNALFAYASVAVFAVFVVLTSVLCFISYKNMQKITAVFAALGIADCVAAMVVISSFAKACGATPVLDGKSGFGLIVTAVLFAAALAVNILLSVKGIPVEYNEGALERVAIRKKVKSGEISIDDLPQPVVETAETRKIDEEIAAAEKAAAEAAAKAAQAE